MSDKGQKVAIITGGSQGIGASLVAAYRRQGWSVVATARTIRPTEDPDVLTVDDGLADPADRIVSGALGRFGRIDTPHQQRRRLHLQARDPSRGDSGSAPELANMAGRDDQRINWSHGHRVGDLVHEPLGAISP